MKPIYLHISNKKGNLINNLEKKYSNVLIEFFETKEQVSELLKTDYFMLILSGEYIEDSTWNKHPLKGEIHIYGSVPPGAVDRLVGKSNIHLYQDILELQAYFQKLLQQEDNLHKDIDIKTETASSTYIPAETRTIDCDSEEIEQLTRNERTSQSKIKKNKVVVQERPMKSTFTCEPIQFKAINLENYPTSFNKDSEKNPYAELDEIIEQKFNPNRNKKKIGIWSPIDNYMDLHLTINFAIYLGQYKLNIGVLETLNKEPKLLEQLSQFQSPPEKWVSFMHPVFFDEPYSPENIGWHYKNVDWHPLSDEIISNVKWNQKDIEKYLHLLSYYDYGFVLLPYGEMLEETVYALQSLNELWVLVDTRKRVGKWIGYIKNIAEYNPGLKVQLININSTSNEDAQTFKDISELPLLTSIPVVFKELRKYENAPNPPISYKIIWRKFKPSFITLRKHLLGTADHLIARAALLEFIDSPFRKLQKINDKA